MHELMQVKPEEDEYMERFINGEYRTELLFSDGAIVERLQDHPMAIWKCRNNAENRKR